MIRRTRRGAARCTADDLDVARDPTCAPASTPPSERSDRGGDRQTAGAGVRQEPVVGPGVRPSARRCSIEYGYADVADWQLTEAGEMLARVFNEVDLLVAEMLRNGLARRSRARPTSPPSCRASSTSIAVRNDPPAPWFSSKDVRSRWNRLAAISEEIRSTERRIGLGEHRRSRPDVRGDRSRLGGRGGVRRDRRRGGVDRWRLRPDDEAAHRPPAPGGQGRVVPTRCARPRVVRSTRRCEALSPTARPRAKPVRMTISKGSDWGDVVARPADLRVAASDARSRTMLTDGSGRPTAVCVGRCPRTVGGRPLDDRDGSRSLPIDLCAYRWIDADPVGRCRPRASLDHPVVRAAVWRGEVLAVMNAEFDRRLRRRPTRASERRTRRDRFTSARRRDSDSGCGGPTAVAAAPDTSRIPRSLFDRSGP